MIKDILIRSRHIEIFARFDPTNPNEIIFKMKSTKLTVAVRTKGINESGMPRTKAILAKVSMTISFLRRAFLRFRISLYVSEIDLDGSGAEGGLD